MNLPKRWDILFRRGIGSFDSKSGSIYEHKSTSAIQFWKIITENVAVYSFFLENYFIIKNFTLMKF